MAEKPGEPSQILRGGCKQHFVPDAAQAPQPKPVEPENPFHVANRISTFLRSRRDCWKGCRIGQRTDTIPHIFVEVAGDFSRDRRRALRLQ
jgi:hypothetical protein